MNRYTKDKEGRDLFHAADWDDNELNPDELYPSEEDIACELQLNAIGDWTLLKFRLNQNQWEKDKTNLEPLWRPFQPRVGILNDRESVLIYGMEGDISTRPTGLSQYLKEFGYIPSESEMKFPTDARKHFKTCDEIFDYFNPVSRTFIIKLNAGGFYPRHRDFPFVNRKTIRLIAFLGDSSDQLEWEVDGRIMPIQQNRIYYVNTAKVHRLCSWKHDSTMVVINIDKTWKNVIKLVGAVEHI